MIKKILCLTLAVLFCLTALMGCKKKTDPNADTSGAPGDTSDTVATEETLNDADTLGEYDFGGAAYKILTRAATDYEHDSKSTAGIQSVSLEIYNRNASVEDRFNVKIEVKSATGGHSNEMNTALINQFRVYSEAGVAGAHLVSDHFAMIQTSSVQKWCLDLTQLATIDMAKEWWCEQFYENCNIDGKFYVAVGDIGYTLYEYMLVTFFNETLAESVVKDAGGNPIDLYQLMREGGWTLDVMKQYTKMLDYTNGGKYGLLLNSHSHRAFITAFEGKLAVREGDSWEYSFPQVADERTVQMMDDVAAFIRDNNHKSVLDNNNTGIDNGNLNPLFNEGNALFYITTLDQITVIADQMQNSNQYGVLPYPKYDSEVQMDYHTPVRDSLSAVCVPRVVDSRDREMVGVVTEALCMYGYQKIRPEYLDNVVKGRYLADDDMKSVLDTLRDTLTLDFAHAYSMPLGYAYSFMDSMISSGTGSDSFSNYYSGKVSGWTTRLADMYTALSNVEG